MSKRRKAEHHVRFYRHELGSAAYRSLSPEARSLLIEARALYTGGDNRIYMSVRWMQERLGIGRWRTERARDELVDRGFLRVLNPGGFNIKRRHATEYALTHIPLKPEKDGATAPKDFMRWQPQKSTVLATSTDGASHQHRGGREKGQLGPDGASHQHREGQSEPLHGASHQHTVTYTRAALLWAALHSEGEAQLKLILAALAPEELRAAA